MGIKMWPPLIKMVVEPAVKGRVGAPAIARSLTVNHPDFNLCLIEGSTPALVRGKIKVVRFYLQGTTPFTVIVGTFYKTNGNDFSSRDSESIVSTVIGLNTATVDLDVEVGDYLGIRLTHMPAGNGLALDYDAGWINDYWRTLAESNFPYVDYTFDNLGKRLISLEGDIYPA